MSRIGLAALAQPARPNRSSVLADYGKTLTVLTCPSVQDETYQEDDGEDEEGSLA